MYHVTMIYHDGIDTPMAALKKPFVVRTEAAQKAAGGKEAIPELYKPGGPAFTLLHASDRKALFIAPKA